MKAEIRVMEVQKEKNVKLYNLIIKDNANYTVLNLDNIDLFGAIKVAQDRKCALINIFER